MRRKVLAIMVLGLGSFFIWSFGFNAMYYRLYLLAGAPEHPPAFVGLLSISALSFLFGAAGAFPTRFIVMQSRLTVAAIFLGSGALCLLASVAYFRGTAGIVDQLSSYGFWGFILGTLVVVCSGVSSTKPHVPATPRSARPAER